MLGIRRAAAAGQATKADRGVGLSGRLGGRNVECRVPRPVPKVPPPPVPAVPRPARSIHRPASGAGKGAVTKDAARQSAGAGRLEPGSADETDAQHRKRHPKFVALCGRCTYDKNRVSLEKSYGSCGTPGAPAGHRTVWAAPRPARMGGHWGVGCVVCARQCEANLDLFAEDRRSGRAKRKAAKRARNTPTPNGHALKSSSRTRLQCEVSDNIRRLLSIAEQFVLCMHLPKLQRALFSVQTMRSYSAELFPNPQIGWRPGVLLETSCPFCKPRNKAPSLPFWLDLGQKPKGVGSSLP